LAIARRCDNGVVVVAAALLHGVGDTGVDEGTALGCRERLVALLDGKGELPFAAFETKGTNDDTILVDLPADD